MQKKILDLKNIKSKFKNHGMELGLTQIKDDKGVSTSTTD